VHHIAFQVASDGMLRHFRKQLVERHLSVSPITDCQYFRSVSFHEPGKVLFELATKAPGFAVDEPLAQLGTHLLLPPQFESRRAQIAA
jgi:glyoxalase family protein